MAVYGLEVKRLLHSLRVVTIRFGVPESDVPQIHTHLLSLFSTITHSQSPQ